jgi:hypothetical protein
MTICKVDSVTRIQGSSVGVATGYRLDDQGSIPGRDKRLFSTQQRPNQLQNPPSLLSNGYQGHLPWE